MAFKIFGMTIGKSEVIDIVTTPEIIPVKIPERPIQNPGLIYNAIGQPNKRRGVFDPPEYDLYEIQKVEDVDGYVRQAFKKKVGLFLKEGFDYVSKDKKAATYIKTRFNQISFVSGIPHNELIRRCVSQFIRKSNAFLIKVRDESASGGKSRVSLSGKKLKPVAGYFPVPAEMMEADVDPYGKPMMWRQKTPRGYFKEFAPEDVVHFTFDRKEGLIFGTPIITPVIDDIRALRKIEENIELLIYKHLFPLFQYIVGTKEMPAGIAEDGRREIDIVRNEIAFMPSEGGIVTPERHEIRAIGAESRALRAEAYLEHFKRRVFAGLGMSAVDYGEGDTSNKSTSDNMSRSLVDDVKDMQDSFEAQFNHFIIQELLLESTFTEDVLSEEKKVELYFREVDIDKQIKVENHAADLFQKNSITLDEARAEMNRDPIVIPDDPEDQDIVKYSEWHRMFWKLFDEPKTFIMSSKGELYSASTIATAASRSTALTATAVAEQQKLQGDAEKDLAVTKEKAKPKPAAKPAKKKDHFLLAGYSSMRGLALEETDINYISQKLRLIGNDMSRLLRTNMNSAFLSSLGPSNLLSKISSVRNSIDRRSGLLIKRLIDDIITMIRRKIDTTTSNGSIIRDIFDSFQYRVDLIATAEIQRASNLGKVISVLSLGATKGKLIITDETCLDCKQHAERLVDLALVSLEDIVPHHPHCRCSMDVAEVN